MENLLNISPLPGFVLIQPLEEDQIKGSAGSFNYADSVEDQEQQKIGKVIAIGRDVRNEHGVDIWCPVGIKPGTIVAHSQYGADKLKYKNQELRFVKFQDLRGVINETKKS